MAELNRYALKVRTRSEAVVALVSVDYYGFEPYCPQVKSAVDYGSKSTSLAASGIL